MKTPWGPSQTTRTLCEGVTSVLTASHGGIIVDAEVADTLSSKAYLIGEPVRGGGLAFEEDCAVAALFAERPDVYRKVREGVQEFWGVDVDQTDDEIAGCMAERRRKWFGAITEERAHALKVKRAQERNAYLERVEELVPTLREGDQLTNDVQDAFWEATGLACRTPGGAKRLFVHTLDALWEAAQGATEAAVSESIWALTGAFRDAAGRADEARPWEANVAKVCRALANYMEALHEDEATCRDLRLEERMRRRLHKKLNAS